MLRRKILRRTALTAVVCSLCMFLYFLTLGVWLPMIWRYEPLWIQEGIYAEYSIYQSSIPLSNSTYRWEIVSIEPDSVLIRDIENATEDVDLLDGVFQGKRLWISNYFNAYLWTLSMPAIEMPGTSGSFRVVGIKELDFNGMSRTCYIVTSDAIHIGPPSSVARYYYDTETGVLMMYFFGARPGVMTWTLDSTNLNWTSTTRSQIKLIVDFVLLTPFFLMPTAAVFYLVRYRGKHALTEESTKSQQKRKNS